MLVLASCGISTGADRPERPNARAPSPVSGTLVSDAKVKIGKPYKVKGRTYTPAEVRSYDETGYASWYGKEFGGNPTANGERFNPNGISAAHKTLPLPTYVEVTSIDTGRTILLRINDRGPFANDRLIDLSFGAAQQLGIVKQGVAGVRVRKVNPTESERAVLRSGGRVIERFNTPESLLSVLRKKLGRLPAPNVAKAPVAQPRQTTSTGRGASYTQRPPSRPAPNASRDGQFIIEGDSNRRAIPPRKAARQTTRQAAGSTSSLVVQLAAFGSKQRAMDFAARAGAKVVTNSAGTVFRVRYGPFASSGEAQQALATAKQKGYANARILNGGRP